MSCVDSLIVLLFDLIGEHVDVGDCNRMYIRNVWCIARRAKANVHEFFEG
jgi:hypothetical protein